MLSTTAVSMQPIRVRFSSVIFIACVMNTDIEGSLLQSSTVGVEMSWEPCNVRLLLRVIASLTRYLPPRRVATTSLLLCTERAAVITSSNVLSSDALMYVVVRVLCGGCNHGWGAG